jgi:hypothetical protein
MAADRSPLAIPLDRFIAFALAVHSPELFF